MMFTKRFPLFFGAAFIAVIALVAILGSLQAQDDPAMVGAPGELFVIASGLANPRGLAFGPGGALYIAESGAGGDGACMQGPDGEQCYGTSGAVSKVLFDSAGKPESQEQIVTGLSSLGAKGSGASATGPNDLAFTGAGDLYVLMGLGANPAVRDPGGPLGAAGINFGQLVAVDNEGNWSNEVDVAAFEASDNPDGAQVDSNPYALLTKDGGFLAVDAGGNSLLNLSMNGNARHLATTADISTVAVFPTTKAEFPPGSGQMIDVDAVPTVVEMGPDGAYYVGLLTGFPFPVGGASIYRVVDGEDPELYLAGFTNIVDLAWGPDGSLFVLEMAKDGLLTPPPAAGQIIQVMPYGARSVFAGEGLITPVDMEIGPDYGLYVANNGISPDKGTVVRFPLPSSTAAIPAAKDNTLYENEAGGLSNGAGQHIFAGITDSKSNNLIRRGAVSFDVTSALPGGATVISATVELNVSRSATGDKQVSLYRFEKGWGEGASDAESNEGAGAPAQSGDATWLHAMFGTSAWNSAGGDFADSDSASAVVGGVGKVRWSSKQLTADVQAWVDGSASNYGWLLRGDESGGASAKRFDSRENSEAANRPKLTVKYIAPLPENAVFTPLVRAAD